MFVAWCAEQMRLEHKLQVSRIRAYTHLPRTEHLACLFRMPALIAKLYGSYDRIAGVLRWRVWVLALTLCPLTTSTPTALWMHSRSSSCPRECPMMSDPMTFSHTKIQVDSWILH